MVSTINSYITSPKSQKALVDNKKSLLAGVAMAAPAIFFEGESDAKTPNDEIRGFGERLSRGR